MEKEVIDHIAGDVHEGLIDRFIRKVSPQSWNFNVHLTTTAATIPAALPQSMVVAARVISGKVYILAIYSTQQTE